MKKDDSLSLSESKRRRLTPCAKLLSWDKLLRATEKSWSPWSMKRGPRLSAYSALDLRWSYGRQIRNSNPSVYMPLACRFKAFSGASYGPMPDREPSKSRTILNVFLDLGLSQMFRGGLSAALFIFN